MWTWVFGALFFPEAWFNEEHVELRKHLVVPEDLQFQTKVEIGWKLIERVTNNGWTEEVVNCDCLYGLELLVTS